MPWLKYRHNFASGKGDWEWIDLGAGANEDEINEAREHHVELLSNEFNWSDKYRGLDDKVIDDSRVPASVVRAAIERNAERFAQAERTAERLDEQSAIVVVCPTCEDGPQQYGAGSWEIYFDACPDCGRAAVIEKRRSPMVRGAK